MAKKNNDFDLVNLPIEAQDPSISAEDFVPTSADKQIHEQHFQTKPTTFFIDSMKRFAKNKSSVVAAVILGLLLILAFVVPAVESDVDKSMTSYATYLEPKLFDSGTGWWDGTKKCVDIALDPVSGLPDPTVYKENAIIGGKSGITRTGRKIRNSPNPYAIGGDVKFYIDRNTTTDLAFFRTNTFLTYKDPSKPMEQRQVIENENVVFDSSKETFGIKFAISNLDYPKEQYPELEFTDFSIAIYYNVDGGSDPYILKEYKKEDIKPSSEFMEIPDVSKQIRDNKDTEMTKFVNPHIAFIIKNQYEDIEYSIMINQLLFDTNGITNNPNLKVGLEEAQFSDANECLLRENKIDINISQDKYKQFINPTGWSSSSFMGLSNAVYESCTFVYDTYEAALGLTKDYPLGNDKLQSYENMGYFKTYLKNAGSSRYVEGSIGDVNRNTQSIKLEILNYDKCPIVPTDPEGDVYKIKNYDSYGWQIDVNILIYKYYGYSSMPRYIFGTDASGHNMNKYVFEGLRNSLLLGIITSAICFVFGLLWGSISGYFGGTTDLVMERFTDILSGVPWIVVMTLCIIKLGQSMLVFGISLCLTGWIGTAATTRTQFYRFKNREYVFASRTLGASDARLIAKHILPNAMGTIITGAVLMIPSVIFSEATISYLGLGLKGMSSLGVILSDNQKELITHPYLLIFPSIIIALIMISFNLFGNGLRDAINPSLKGEDE